MASVFDVSNYILQLSNSIDSDERDLISNLKLQKLLYYCYGFSLVLLKKKLFNDDKIKAWPLGPVCPKVHNKYKKYESNPIPIEDVINSKLKLSGKEKELINEVYSIYGQFSAWKLKDMTHQESPWKNTKRNYTISDEEMKNFFITRLQ